MNKSSSAVWRLEVQGISRRFGSTLALSEVSLCVAPGEIRALIGENGAGKSTLMKIIAGAECPDSGTIRLDGSVFSPTDPLSARQAGVAMIHQEVLVAPHLSVAENIVLGREDQRLGFLRPQIQAKRIDAALHRLGRPDIRPETLAGDLSPAGRQLIEIARVIAYDARVVIMDEPTSSLGPSDIKHLFGVIRELQKDGRSVIYISHFLDEVMRIADTYTTLRDGRVVSEGKIAETDTGQIVEDMLGRRLGELYCRTRRSPGEVVLEATEVRGQNAPVSSSFTVQRGEILGISGLLGSGRTELARCLTALDPVVSGTIRVGLFPGLTATPWTRIRQGLGLLSEDRSGEGLAVQRSVAENITLSRIENISRFGMIQAQREHNVCADWIRRLSIKCPSPDHPVHTLSGGHQQKTALARLLHQDADILILDEPTRGIDVGSKAEIYRLLDQLVLEGKAIILISSSPAEILGLADRVAVMFRGTLSDATPVTEWDERRLARVAAEGF